MPNTLNCVVTKVANCGAYAAGGFGTIFTLTHFVQSVSPFASGWTGTITNDPGPPAVTIGVTLQCSSPWIFVSCTSPQWSCNLTIGHGFTACAGNSCSPANSCPPTFDINFDFLLNVNAGFCLTPPCEVAVHIYQ